MFAPAAQPAQGIADMALVLIVGAVVIFVVVMALLLVVVFKRRHAAAAVAQRQKLLWVAGGGVLFPVVVLTALHLYATARTVPLADTQRQAGDVMVGVTARMWWWEVRYRDAASGREVVLANEIRVPVQRHVSLGLSSADVIHSFWVPALAGKVDMVPGRVHQLRLQVGEAGIFRGQCAEYCGEQHARMALHVVAMEPQAFDRWLSEQALPAVAPASALAERGRQLFVELRCNACHAVRGLVEAGPGQAPDLTHVGSRLALGAGTLPMHREAIGRWVSETQRLKPGARMPSFQQLDDETVQALAEFLAGLR